MLKIASYSEFMMNNFFSLIVFVVVFSTLWNNMQFNAELLHIFHSSIFVTGALLLLQTADRRNKFQIYNKMDINSSRA